VKFLLDVCVSSRSLTAFLASRGHDVISALAIDPKASDQVLMAAALHDDRILVTEDKDFGELVFVLRLPHGPIIRVVELTVAEQVDAVKELLDHHATELVGAVIVTVSKGRLRIRQGPGTAAGS
jgi:predicted nuclease of predicted toxin-antitoxin system